MAQTKKTKKSVRALNAKRTAHSKQIEAENAARKLVSTKVGAVVSQLENACSALLVSKLPDRFLRLQRFARFGQQLQLELSDRVADLRAQGGVRGEYDDYGDGLGLGEYGRIGGGRVGGIGMMQPVPDNVQLLREMIPAVNDLNALKAKLPPEKVSPYDLSSALDAKKALKEAGESTKEIDAYIAAAKGALKKQAVAIEKGEPDPKAVIALERVEAEKNLVNKVARVNPAGALGGQIGGMVGLEG